MYDDENVNPKVYKKHPPLVLSRKAMEAWEKEEKKKKEILYQKHHPTSFFTKFASVFDDDNVDGEQYELPNGENFPQTETHVSENAAEAFLDYVQKVADEVYKKYIINPRKIIMTDDDNVKYESATHCHICEDKLAPTHAHCHRENENVKNCELCQKN